MQEMQAVAAVRRLDLYMASFSVDPEHDTPPVLLGYAERHGANLERWSFVTGDHKMMQQTAVDGFKLALEGKADPEAPEFGIIHGSHLVLVDKGLSIRGYYKTSEPSESGKLLADAERLVTEK
jgi:protein SCO1/2